MSGHVVCGMMIMVPYWFSKTGIKLLLNVLMETLVDI